MTLWECLGVLKTCSDEELKSAFRRKCHELHPDKTGNDPKKTITFVTMKQVYEKEMKRREESKKSPASDLGFRPSGVWFHSSATTSAGESTVHFDFTDFTVDVDALLKKYNEDLGLKKKTDWSAAAKDAEKKRRQQGGK